MTENLIIRLATAACGFLFMVAPPAYSRTQAPPSASAQTSSQTSPPMQSNRAASPHPASPMDDFAGLDLAEDQKEKVGHIQSDFQSRINIVANSNTLDADQKNAFLEGYQRMEYREIYESLTSEQQAAVRKKAAARRAAERQEKQKQSRPN